MHSTETISVGTAETISVDLAEMVSVESCFLGVTEQAIIFLSKVHAMRTFLVQQEIFEN